MPVDAMVDDKKKFEKVFFIFANFFFSILLHSGPENLKRGPADRKYVFSCFHLLNFKFEGKYSKKNFCEIDLIDFTSFF